MLPTTLVHEIDRLLKEGRLSQRQIAAHLRVSRGTVNSIANGRRGLSGMDHADARPLHSPASAPRRCPSCGYRVYLPCLICRTRGYKKHSRTELCDTPRTTVHTKSDAFAHSSQTSSANGLRRAENFIPLCRVT